MFGLGDRLPDRVILECDLGVEVGVMEFEEFYRRQFPTLLRLCFLVAVDDAAAADAAQEAMLRAWDGWDRWERLRDGQPVAWVQMVALNLLRSRWRRIQVELRLAPRLYERPRSTPSRDLDVLRSLRQLSVRQRQAMVLFYWADLSIEGCAEVMAISPGAVKRHLERARKRLGEEVADMRLEGGER